MLPISVMRKTEQLAERETVLPISYVMRDPRLEHVNTP